MNRKFRSGPPFLDVQRTEDRGLPVKRSVIYGSEDLSSTGRVTVRSEVDILTSTNFKLMLLEFRERHPLGQGKRS